MDAACIHKFAWRVASIAARRWRAGGRAGICEMRKTNGTKKSRMISIKSFPRSEAALPSCNDRSEQDPKIFRICGSAIFEMAELYSDLRKTVLWRSDLDGRK
jgi:hypothetical protein